MMYIKKFPSSIRSQLIHVASAVILLLNTVCLGQATKSLVKKNWSVKPDYKVFVENLGQFDADVQTSDKILYEVKLGNVKVCFTSHGLIYRYDKYTTVKKDEKSAKKGKDDNEKGDDLDEETIKDEPFYINSTWEGAGSDISITASGEQTYYYTYASKKGIKANAFKKIIYNNLYPGIDAEYTFPTDDNGGIEYTLIVHPGANLSQVKLRYTGATKLKMDNKGNVTIHGDFDLTENIPVSYYKEGGEIQTMFHLKDNEESFLVKGKNTYDKSKTLVIDPRITVPFSNNSAVGGYDLDYDYDGNIYAYDGGNFVLTKYNSAGTQLWIFDTHNSYSFGGFAVDKTTGSSFVIEGFGTSNVEKVDNMGNLLLEQVVDPAVDEMWRIAYNPCQQNFVVGAGGNLTIPGAPQQAFTMDTNLNLINAANIANVPLNHYGHDITLLALDPSNSGVCYMATCESTISSGADNVLFKLPLPSLVPTQYAVKDGFNFLEIGFGCCSSIVYAGGLANGMNGMAVSNKWLYMYDGSTLKRFNKNTGAQVDSIFVNPSTYSGGAIQVNWGGIAVDNCDNVYLGSQGSVVEYDSTLTSFTTIASSFPGNVTDVVLNNDTVYAVGGGFLSSVTVTPATCVAPPPPPPPLIASSPDYCSQPYITITAPANGSSYLWSGPCISGANNEQSVKITCAGTYSVTVGGLIGPPTCASVTLSINIPSASGTTPVPSFTADTVCDGYATQFKNTSNPLSGSGVKFYWDFYNNGTYEDSTTNPSFLFPDPGIYHVSLHEVINGDCGGDMDSILTVVVDTPSTVTEFSNDFFIATCMGQPVGFINYSNDAGTVQYIWNFGDPSSGTLDTTSITTMPTHIFDTAGTYTITLWPKQPIPCHDSGKLVIHVVPFQPPTGLIGSNYDCGSNVVTFSDLDSLPNNSNGTEFYEWTIYGSYYPPCGGCGNDTNPAPGGGIVANTGPIPLHPYIYGWTQDTGSYTVVLEVLTATSGGYCPNQPDTMRLTLGKPLAEIYGNDSICQGSETLLTASGGAPYVWSPSGKTTDTITVAKAGIYTLTSNSGVCGGNTTFTLIVNPLPVPGPITQTQENCAIDSVTLKASGGTSYKWSNSSATTDSVHVSVASAATYTVTVINANGCSASTTTFVNESNPSLVPHSDTTINLGESAHLSVSSVDMVSYKWTSSPPYLFSCSTCPNITVTPTVTTTYSVTGTDSLGCPLTGFVIVIVKEACDSLIVPNVFTPGFAGISGTDNVLYIKNAANMTSGSLYIYDRWGKEMYTTTNLTIPWTGTTESGAQAPDGVYYYIITATCEGTTYKKHGFVQLIR